MESALTEYGVAGILVIIILREVFNFLKSQKVKKIENGDYSNKKIFDFLVQLNGKINDANREIHDLYQWHDVKDGDGVPIWYIRRSLEEAIKALADNVGEQTKVFQGLVVHIENLAKSKNS